MEDTILDEAAKLVDGERNVDYGDPIDNMTQIADLWNTYIGLAGDIAINARDVTMMMILIKVARDTTSHKRDNLIDIAGYARVAERLNEPDPNKLTHG